MVKTRTPLEGDFPLLVLRKRGPCNMASIIRMSKSITYFLELLKKHFTARTIERISTRTRQQSRSSYWFLYRRCLITGTIAKRVINQNKRGEKNEKLNRCISRFFPGSFTNEAMMYGVANEKRAMETFFNVFKTMHTDAKLHEIGLVLYKDAPYIGGSPDGIVTCDCCSTSYLIEIKCPFRLAETGIKNWRILEYFDDSQNLKPSHTYFNQINLYQGILGLKTAFFVVFANDEIITKRITFDKDFFDFQIKNLTEYYTKYYLPTVIGTKI